MSDTDTKEKTYNPFQLFDAHDGPVPASFVQRRRVSAAIRQITAKLIRIDADDDQLSAWADRLETLQQELAEYEQLDTQATSRKLFSGKATASDVFQMMDYNPVGGASNPIAPELTWVRHSPEGVEAQVCLGLPYQGPVGRIHGGVIAWMMDAVLARALNAAFKIAMTGTLSLRYLAATPLFETVSLRAEVVRQEGRKIFVEGGIWHGDKQTVAVEGVWLVPKAFGG